MFLPHTTHSIIPLEAQVKVTYREGPVFNVTNLCSQLGTFGAHIVIGCLLTLGSNRVSPLNSGIRSQLAKFQPGRITTSGSATCTVPVLLCLHATITITLYYSVT